MHPAQAAAESSALPAVSPRDEGKEALLPAEPGGEVWGGVRVSSWGYTWLCSELSALYSHGLKGVRQNMIQALLNKAWVARFGRLILRLLLP